MVLAHCISPYEIMPSYSDRSADFVDEDKARQKSLNVPMHLRCATQDRRQLSGDCRRPLSSSAFP